MQKRRGTKNELEVYCIQCTEVCYELSRIGNNCEEVSVRLSNCTNRIVGGRGMDVTRNVRRKGRCLISSTRVS